MTPHFDIMAENKKSFVLYADMISVVKKLPRETMGDLFLTILEYVNDLNPTIEHDLLLEIAFEPIKLQLKRDLKRWDEFKEKQSANGSKGGRPKNNTTLTENPKNPSLLLESQKSLNVTVNDTVNDTVNAIEEKKEILSFESFWDLFNKKIDSKKCRSKFDKLPEKDKVKIKNTLPNYIGLTPDVKFRKNPLTYLNGCCWNDEISLSPIISEENRICLYTNQSIQRENKEVEGTYSRYLRDVECYGVDNVKFISYV